MYRTILVQLDGSALAERALPLAEALAAAGGDRLVLVRAAQAHEPLEGEGHLVEAERQVAETAEDYLATVAGRLDEAQYVQWHVYSGPPAEGILEEARLYDADLVVMATHARAGVERWFFGSVADDVLRHTTAPVLLVPVACRRVWERGRPLRVVLPLDGSAFALEALAAARKLARLAGGADLELELLQVVEPARLSVYALPIQQLVIDPEAELAAARRYLDGVADSVRGIAREVTVHAAVGSPGANIATLARELNADLVVMAMHGRGGLSRLMLGSTAAETLRHASTPPLLVRPVGLRQLATAATAPRAAVERQPLPLGLGAAARFVAAAAGVAAITSA